MPPVKVRNSGYAETPESTDSGSTSLIREIVSRFAARTNRRSFLTPLSFPGRSGASNPSSTFWILKNPPSRSHQADYWKLLSTLL